MNDQGRKPVRESYDALVTIGADVDHEPSAYALVKFTYAVKDGISTLTAAEPLLYDPRDKEAKPRLHPGTDHWPSKRATDVVVQGSAYAPNGKPTSQTTISVEFGNRNVEALVFGNRAISWKNGGKPTIEPVEPFSEMPVTYQNAYGGLDWRTPIPDDPRIESAVALDYDHPGLYPRNPMGRGYFVMPDALEDALMPNIEDPQDQLTADRLIVNDPKSWYRQPLPISFDWTPILSFPRYLYANCEPMYAAPQDSEMPEVASGQLPTDYQIRFDQYFEDNDAHIHFRQGAYR